MTESDKFKRNSERPLVAESRP